MSVCVCVCFSILWYLIMPGRGGIAVGGASESQTPPSTSSQLQAAAAVAQLSRMTGVTGVTGVSGIPQLVVGHRTAEPL